MNSSFDIAKEGVDELFPMWQVFIAAAVLALMMNISFSYNGFDVPFVVGWLCIVFPLMLGYLVIARYVYLCFAWGMCRVLDLIFKRARR